MKKWLCLALTGVMLLSLTACNDAQTKSAHDCSDNLSIATTTTTTVSEADKAAIQAFLTDPDNNGFLQSDYACQDDISLLAVFYDGAGVGTSGTADWTEQEKQDVLAAAGWDAFHIPPLKLKRADVNAVLKAKLGISLDIMKDKMYAQFCYVSKYDAFYAMHGDTNYAAVTVKDVQYDTKGRYLVSYTMDTITPQSGTVTLSKSDTGFCFQSNNRG